MTRRPLKATDRRRNQRKTERIDQPDDDGGTGRADALADLFNDRRKPNGRARRAIK